MLISCPCCNRKISNTAEACPWCGCNVQKELRENIEFAVWGIKWFAIPLMVFIFSVCTLFKDNEENSDLCLWIWLIAQIGWVIFLKRDVFAQQTSDKDNAENQNSIDSANSETPILHNTYQSSQSNQSVNKSQNTTKKQRGRKIEI